MNRETIEKAAIESAKGACSDFDAAFEYANGFVFGARWRINAAWHNASEIPQDMPTLVEYPLFGGRYGYVVTNKPSGLMDSITRWAYVADLLPETGEEATR